MNKNEFVLVQKQKIGNFKENSCVKKWDISYDNSLDFIMEENGSYMLCVCKNNITAKKTIEIKAIANYDTKIEFDYDLFIGSAYLSVMIMRNGLKNKCNLAENKKVSEQLKKNDEFIVKIQVNSSDCGDVIGTIKNMKIVLNEYEEVKVDLNTFILNLKTNNK